MSDYQTTQYNHYVKALSAVKDAFYFMRINKSTHKKCMEMLNQRVYTTNHYQRLNQTYKARLSGYIDAQWENNYRFIFWAGILNGRVVEMKQIDKQPDWPGWTQWTAEEGHGNHYWIEPCSDGSYKLYS